MPKPPRTHFRLQTQEWWKSKQAYLHRVDGPAYVDSAPPTFLSVQLGVVGALLEWYDEGTLLLATQYLLQQRGPDA